ncbi:glycosyltransferase, group 1 family protein [Toxoplasma gondii GAB2-2007-GAL-DOM2]|uniref:Alpha-1,3/1,6-mannosyltransferase ALG2 n=4 Tax=Toxoplasma gondii TaxID=5811 RepID=S7UX22_TOXGG|nr:glycosyltransferase, group 1 family protein [Toxoplasma gondii GT1]KFG45083.1 glycosyltransferase, group 1 family protein [Toxoplasma gondii GAB2-2007-GAL-DOM2]KFG52042.1 glycosyltransferase, group 1 family protein [Toxoplasma gondii FOU]RQX74373.1 glycosyltransferase, group 1 family protein [Toxoplasma gondii CAST]
MATRGEALSSEGDENIEQSQGHRGTHADRPKCTIVHLDLGIGGAEHLIVLAALAMQGRDSTSERADSRGQQKAEENGSRADDGYDVEVITTRHDRNRCFPATVDGRLKVFEYGHFLPRSIFGKAVAFCSLLRMLWLVLVILVTGRWRRNVIINDQVAAVNPLLSFFCEKLVFYAHFPDLLLVKRTPHSPGFFAALKKLYRVVMDGIEEATTGKCDLLLFNSRFTEQTFRRTFPSLRFPPHTVLYPPVDTAGADAFRRRFSRDACIASLKALPEFKNFDFSVPFVFSLNRYEKKKDLPLAIHAVAHARGHDAAGAPLNLVMAGGFCSQLPENGEVFADLLRLARMQSELDVLWPAAASEQGSSGAPENTERTQVLFLKNISEETRQSLMALALCLVYTPFEEHFGMVPLEANALGCPVVASNSGGPRESILHGKTRKGVAAARSSLALHSEMRPGVSVRTRRG